MTSFQEFRQAWEKRFPAEDVPTKGWDEDIQANLAKHREKLENLKREIEKEEFYVNFLEASLADFEKQKNLVTKEKEPGFVTVIEISNKELREPEKTVTNYENVNPPVKNNKVPPKPLAKPFKRFVSEDTSTQDVVAWTKQQIQQLSAAKIQQVKDRDIAVDDGTVELRHVRKNYENVGTRSNYENVFPDSSQSAQEKHASLPVTNLDEDPGRVRRAAAFFQQHRSHSVPAASLQSNGEPGYNLYDTVSQEDLIELDAEADYVYLAEKQGSQSEEDRFDNSTLGSQKSLSSTDNSSLGSLNRHYANLTSLDDLDWPKSESSKKHQYVLQSLLDSEESFVDTLDMLLQYKKALVAALNASQPIISAEDINTIFYLIPQLHEQHSVFAQQLQQARNNGWDLSIVVSKLLQISQECLTLYSGYLRNYGKAVDATRNAVQNSPQFAKLARDIKTRVRDQQQLTSIEEMLHKPVARIQRHVAVLKDLMDCVGANDPNFTLLAEAHRLTRNFLHEFSTSQLCNLFPGQSGKHQGPVAVVRHLVRNGFLVELLPDGSRKQRHVFLFTDLIVCTKYKSAAANAATLEVKWYVPISSLTAQTDDSGSAKNLNVSAVTHVVALRAQAAAVRTQMQRSGTAAEKHRKKLASLEAKLLLNSPNLPLKISYKPKGSRSVQAHTFLLSSNYERSVWLEAIHIQQQTSRAMEFPSLEEVENYIKAYKTAVEPPLGFARSSAVPAISGELQIVVHSLNGLPRPADTCIVLEVDSYGHYFHKASTKLVCNSANPTWEEDFSVELEGARGLRALLYQDEGQSGHVLRGKTEIELNLSWLQSLRGQNNFPLTVQTSSTSSGLNAFNQEVNLCMTLKYISHDLTLRRPVNRRTSQGIFGVAVEELCEREKRPVPYLVMCCVREVERRGLGELGIYRVSGSSTDIAKLRKAFESHKQDCETMLREVDIHTVSGLLKLYLRQLPEALFTDKLYPQFLQAFTSLGGSSVSQSGSDDLSAGSGAATLIQLFSSLPQVNQNVIVYILEHLVRVNNAEIHNKMSLHNLATVFGPNLLRPATPLGLPEGHQADLLALGTVDVMAQAGILHFFLLRRAKGEPIQSLSR